MAIDKELERLKKELRAGEIKVEKAQKKAEIEIEKKRIRKKLLLLKHPTKIALAKRLGRGIKITGKKVGKATLKQAKLIEAQQERDRRIEVAREKMLSKPVKVRKGKKKKSRSNIGDGFDLMKLDF